MPDFVHLDRAEALAWRRFVRARDQQARLELLRHAARARVRVASAISRTLNPARRTDARLLSELATRTATAYRRLGHLDGAIRFCRGLANVSAKRAGMSREIER